MAKKPAKKVLTIRRVVRVDLKDKLDSHTILLLKAYCEWHQTQTGEEVTLGEALDAAFSEQVMAIPGFRAFFKEFSERTQPADGERRKRGAGGGGAGDLQGAASPPLTGAGGGASPGTAKASS